MSRSLAVGAALLALSALAPAAEARMPGGPAGPTSLSRADTRIPSSIGSVRTFGADSRMASPDGLQLRVKGGHWKKPVEADGGGPDDPPNKPTGGSNTGSSGGSKPDYQGPKFGGHYGPYGGQPGLPLACKGRPGGC